MTRTRRGSAFVTAFLTDESGQDVVEYALLGALVGVASIATWKALATTVGGVYLQVDSGTQSLTAPPNPIPPS